VDFAYDETVKDYQGRLLDFMERRVYPAEQRFVEEVQASGSPYDRPPVMEELQREARQQGLWNLFLPDRRWGPGLTNLQYAPLAEISGRSPIAPEAMNCSAPDTGNMEILAQFGTREQQERWLRPLLDARMRSCFCMTEPDVASSDARNIRTRIRREGDGYIIDGHKWWSTGAGRELCQIAIVMGQTDPNDEDYRQQSMILVPLDTPGVRVIRNLPVFGFLENASHGEVVFENVKVPASNLLGGEGAGFAIAQARLGPGRIHHCMRMVGMAERALELMCRRVQARVAFGRPLAEQGVIQDWIARSRIEIEQTRLLLLKAAWMMDTSGNREARMEIAGIKVAAANMACRVVDRAIQAHGGAGVTEDFPLAAMYAYARTLRLADGPDEVHLMTIARRELAKWREASGEARTAPPARPAYEGGV
jgi:acyl-CoA dehydrogenase